MQRWIPTSLVALALCAAPISAQTTLRFKFKEGEKINYVMDQDMKMAMSVNGMDIDMKMGNQMDMTWSVIKVASSGDAQVEVKTTRVKMTMEGPMGKTEVDSKDDNEPDDPMGKIFSQIVKSIAAMDMSFTMTPAGEIKDVKMAEKALKALKNLPGAEQFGEMFGPDSLKKMVQGQMVMPKEPVKKGASWIEKMDIKTPVGQMKGDTRYTYEGPATKDGRTLEKIAIKPDFKIEADANAPIQIKIKGQEGKGHTLFDNEAGRVASTSMEQTLDMAVEVNGMTINQRIVTNMTMKLKK